jgi:hypothetical protein
MRKVFWLIAVVVLLGFGYYTLRDKIGQPETDTREVAALRALETLVEAQQKYRDRYGRYAQYIYQLGPPRGPQRPSEDAANLVPLDLASGRRFGYQFRVRGYGDSFSVNADPQAGSADGIHLRHFYTDQTGVVRQSTAGAASESSPEVL